jgi:FtsH-binding integral membrane protein
MRVLQTLGVLYGFLAALLLSTIFKFTNSRDGPNWFLKLRGYNETTIVADQVQFQLYVYAVCGFVGLLSLLFFTIILLGEGYSNRLSRRKYSVYFVVIWIASVFGFLFPIFLKSFPLVFVSLMASAALAFIVSQMIKRINKPDLISIRQFMRFALIGLFVSFPILSQLL